MSSNDTDVVLKTAVPSHVSCFLLQSSISNPSYLPLKFIRHNIVNFEDDLNKMNNDVQKESSVTNAGLANIAQRSEGMK